MELNGIFIGFDWDGTLELFELKPSQNFIRYLAQLKQRGAQFFLASGKTCSNLASCSRGILEPFLIAGESGGHICIPSQNKEYFSQGDEDLFLFSELVKDYPLPPNSPHPLSKTTIWCRMFGEHALEGAAALQKIIDEHHLHLEVFPHPEIDGAVDVVPRDISKANVLKYLPPQAPVYYFGDGLNDVPLLEHPRVFPSTVGNAHTDVKKLVQTRQGKISRQLACLGVHEILLDLFQ